MTKLTPEQVMVVLDLFAFDDCGMLFWRTDTQYAPVTFFVNVNDTFYYASADCEEITQENLDLAIQTKKDVESITGRHRAWDWPVLFVARVRKMRPLHPVYKDAHPEVIKLFEEVAA